MKILFITQICPYPPTNGGAIKTYNILKHLGTYSSVNLLTFIRSEDEISNLSQLSPYCGSVNYCMITRSTGLNIMHAAKSLLKRESFIVKRDWHPTMQAKVLEAIGDNPDLIYIDHLQMFQFVPDNPPCPVLLDEHNVEWRIIERFTSSEIPLSQRIFASIEWQKLKSYELSACNRANMVLTVTPDDRDILVQNGIPSDKITALPIGVDTSGIQPVRLQAESKKILTFGTMSWPPNIDSVLYFAKSIYPLIKREVHDVCFLIAGANPPDEVTALGRSDSSIEVTGYVPDIRETAEDTSVFIVPLRIGSGMRVKILDAMALGLPVVTTSIGCEGIDLIHGEHALVEDTAEGFAKAVIGLLADYDERLRLGRAGRNLIEKSYSWPPILSNLDEAIQKLIPR